MRKFLVLIILVCNFFIAYSQSTLLDKSVRNEFTQSLINTSKTKTIKLGKTIYQGVFTGNGLLGTMTYIKNGNTLRINVGRTDVYDTRKGEDNLFERPRLIIGHFEVKLSDSIKIATGNIDIFNAQANAELQTEQGVFLVKSTTLANENFILLEINDKNYKGKYSVQWIPEKSESPRINFSYVKKPEIYHANPQVEKFVNKKIKGTYQALIGGGNYSVGYLNNIIENNKYLLINIDYQRDNTSSKLNVIQALEKFSWANLNQKMLNHRQWWHNYYAKSALNIPDLELQNFYNYQLYKLASASRADKPAIDLQGPWTDKTPWPGYWFNLNMQLTYSPLYLSNHLDIAQSLVNMIDKNVENLKLNVPKQYRNNSIAIGRSASSNMLRPVKLVKGDTTSLAHSNAELSNLTWLLYYYYQHYDVTRDKVLKTKLFDLLKRSVNYYIHLLEKNNEGKYQIAVKTYSPEYTKGYAYNTNYDLSTLRWGLKTLIKLDKENSNSDKLAATWKDIYQNLIDFPKDKSGYLIAKDTPYEVSHRHYSHLMMIYPYYEVNWDQVENRDIIETSIRTWQSKPQALQGYSLTGHASMKAMMGRGNEARDILKSFIKKFVKPNTLYAETGPVIETPLAAMQSIQELFVQNWNDGMIRIFPAIPDDWVNVSFENFRVSGAFLISATKSNNKTSSLKIYSEIGGKIKLKLPNEFFYQISKSGKLLVKNNDIYEFEIPKSETLILQEK